MTVEPQSARQIAAAWPVVDPSGARSVSAWRVGAWPHARPHHVRRHHAGCVLDQFGGRLQRRRIVGSHRFGGEHRHCARLHRKHLSPIVLDQEHRVRWRVVARWLRRHRRGAERLPGFRQLRSRVDDRDVRRDEFVYPVATVEATVLAKWGPNAGKQ